MTRADPSFDTLELQTYYSVSFRHFYLKARCLPTLSSNLILDHFNDRLLSFVGKIMRGGMPAPCDCKRINNNWVPGLKEIIVRTLHKSLPQ